MPCTPFQYSTRLNALKARPELFDWHFSPSDVRDLIRRAQQIKDLCSITLNYPEHLENVELSDIEQSVAQSGLKVSGINLRYPQNVFSEGAFTNPVQHTRKAAIDLTCEAADIGRRLNAPHLILWLGNDGFDYPFQLDYLQAWDWEIEGIHAVATYAKDIKVSIEYKPSDPRRFCLLGDVGTTLLALDECASANLGVTLDFCHMLMANEHPALSTALCFKKNRLFGIHLNDGYRTNDDGLIVGSVNLFQTFELIYQLVTFGYSEVLYFDTFPIREDPVLECTHNIERIDCMIQMIEKLDEPSLHAARLRQDGLASTQLIWKRLFAQ